MRCPSCQTENRDDRETCYHCGKNLVMLRLIINKAKAHFNAAVEHAEHARYYEALGELNSALELNTRMVEARVLRGSILARLERPEEARSSWEEALAVQPQLARAHRYLDELQDYETALPLTRRLKKLIGIGIGVIAGVLLIGLIALAWGAASRANQREEIERTRLGWTALQDGDFREARRLAAALEPGQQNELLSAVDVAIESQLRAAKSLLQAGDRSAALEKVRSLEEEGLPDTHKLAVQEVENAIAASLLGELRALEDNELPSDKTLERINQLTQQFEKLFPSQADLLEEQQREWRDNAREEFQELLAQIDARLDNQEKVAEIPNLLDEASRWSAVLGESRRLMQRRQRFVDYRSSQLLAQAMEAADANDLQAYDRALLDLKNLDMVGDETVREAEALRQVFVERRQEEMRGAIVAALDENENERALTLAQSLRDLGGSVGEELESQLEHARRQLAIDSYYALMEMGDEIEGSDLSEERARRVMTLVERTRGQLPYALASRAETHLLFFEARAEQALGNTEEAQAAATRLREIAPASPYLEHL